MTTRQSRASNKRILFLSFCLGSLVMLVVHIGSNLLHSDQDEGAIRLTSLGTPKIVPIDPSKGEQKVLMNDPSIQRNWGLMGTGGQSDIKADAAWNITQGDRRVVVAIIDTGVDVHHPDLADNLWINPKYIDQKTGQRLPTNVDYVQDGYVGDIHGWNFVDNNNDLTDHHGHGTHIAGIIGAVGGNGIGISGVCPKVSLMILKYFDPQARGNDNLKNTIKAIRYAVDHGANIINYSGGGTEPNDDEFEAIKYAEKKGVLYVAAAGNEHSDSDVSHYYPADYDLSNIISVTAIDSFANVLKSSNYGSRSVHIAAPGEGIYSTLPGGNYGYMTGTSQATAFVSGVAALILSHNKDFNVFQVKDQIVRTADQLPGLRDKTMSGGKLNSYAALAIQPSIPASGLTTAKNTPNVGVIDDKKNEEGLPEEENDDNQNHAGLKLTNFIKHMSRSAASVKPASRFNGG